MLVLHVEHCSHATFSQYHIYPKQIKSASVDSAATPLNHNNWLWLNRRSYTSVGFEQASHNDFLETCVTTERSEVGRHLELRGHNRRHFTKDRMTGRQHKTVYWHRKTFWIHINLFTKCHSPYPVFDGSMRLLWCSVRPLEKVFFMAWRWRLNSRKWCEGLWENGAWISELLKKLVLYHRSWWSH